MEKLLKELQEIDINTVDINTLKDIRDIHIDKLSIKEISKLSLEEIKSLYFYRYKDIVIKVSFTETGTSQRERLKNYILMDL